MPVENWTSNELDDLIAFRRDLHENPELLYDVNRTAKNWQTHCVRLALTKW